VPILFGQSHTDWPERFDVHIPQPYMPSQIPLVIFSSYRPAYLERTLASISESGSVESHTPCLFILHQTKSATMDDINETYKVLGKITFCRKMVLTFGNEKEARSSEGVKFLWWQVMKKVFNDMDAFQMKVNTSHEGDVIFIEDDSIVSPDFLEAMWYANVVKNVVSDVLISTLQGFKSGNLNEPDPDAFVVRRVPALQTNCYSFNASVWRYLKKFEKGSLELSNSDWQFALGVLTYNDRNETLKTVTPTVSRVWHIGPNFLAHNYSDNSDDKVLEGLPPWKTIKRQNWLNVQHAHVLPGVRDMYGRLCHHCEMESQIFKFNEKEYKCHCMCPTSNLKKYVNWMMSAFVPKTHRQNHCVMASHLMIVVLCSLLGLSLFGYLVIRR